MGKIIILVIKSCKSLFFFFCGRMYVCGYYWRKWFGFVVGESGWFLDEVFMVRES